jgi:hypothetical protein
VMIGSLISGTYFDFQRRAIEPREWVPRHPGGPGIFDRL